MNDLLLYLTTTNQQYSAGITWGGFLILLLCVVIFSKPALVQKWKEWRMERCIANSSQEMLQDVFLSDGVDGVHYYPFIILTRQTVVFFKVMQIKGVIFAADTIDYWTQVVGKRSYKFHNPLPGLEAEKASIRAVDKNISVEGRVVFTRDSHFPKGRPETIILETEIKELLQEKMQGEMAASLMQSWGLLKTSAEEGQLEKQNKLLMSKPKILSTFRCRAAWLFALLSIVWLILRLV